MKEPKKNLHVFNLVQELQKVKIEVPLSEFPQNLIYHAQLQKFLQAASSTTEQDTMNLHDEHPTVIPGTQVEDRDDSVPPFYVTLTIHDIMLHYCMLKFGASHNLMPKSVMEDLGLEITKLYHDLYSFDSRTVQFLGLIQHLVLTPTQLLMKSIVLDIVVANIPANIWNVTIKILRRNAGGTLQMDMKYAIVLIFDGEKKKICRENKLKYVVKNGKKPKNPQYKLLMMLWIVFNWL